jgi:exodeoxyribonuclease VIII
MVLAVNMAIAVQGHPYANALLSHGKAEESFWADDTPTGLRVKARPDWYFGGTIVDLKTCQDASPSGFARACATFSYHVQAAHYLNVTFAERFIFIAVEKTYPF